MISFLFVALSSAAQASDPKLEDIGQARHPGHVVALATSPDSQVVYFARNDRWLLAYSLATQQTRGRRFFGDLHGLAVSPHGDRVVVTTSDDVLSVLDSASLQIVLTQKMDSGPERVRFTPDGAWILVTTGTGHLVKLRTEDLAVGADIFPTEGSRVLDLCCSPDNTLVATSDREGKIKFWSLDSFGLVTEFKADDLPVRCLMVDPTGRYLASAGTGGSLKVWDLPSLTLVKETKRLHQETIRSIAFSSDGRMVTCGLDGLCQFWNPGDFTPGRSFTEYRGYYTSGSITQDGKWLVRGGSTLDLVPMDHPEAVSRVGSYGGAILALATTPGSPEMLTGGLDRGLFHWKINTEDPRDIRSKSTFLEDWVTAVAFARNGQTAVAGLMNGTVEILGLPALSREKSWQAHKSRVTQLAASDDRIVTIGDDNAVRVWAMDGKRVAESLLDAPCRSLALHGTRIAVGTSNGDIRISEHLDQLQFHVVKGRPLSVTALTFVRNGAELIVGYFDGGIEAYSTSTWRVSSTHPGDGSGALRISPHPVNDTIAVGYRDGGIALLADGSLKRIARWDSESAEIFGLGWVLDSNTLAAAGASNNVSLKRIRSQPATAGGAAE